MSILSIDNIVNEINVIQDHCADITQFIDEANDYLNNAYLTEEQYEKLKAQRTKLQNRIRRADPETQAVLREEKAGLTAQITELRKRLKCNYCFGGLEIIGARGSLTDDDITTEQGACLLSYLLLNSQYPRPIRELADVLWPEEAVDNPYHDVKNVVYRLKRTLGLIGLEDLIIAQGGTFILNPHYEIQTDFERFEEACEKIAKECNHDVISALYHGAMDLYKGNLLPRFDHMQWQMPRSAYFENMYLRLVKCCIAYKFENHDYAAAQKTAVAALAREPYDTELMVALTISVCEQGNRSLAYSYFCKIKPQLTDEQIEMLLEHCKKTK